MRRPRTNRKGQATLEYVILLMGVITPLTLGIVALGQMLWIWNTAVEYTRLGARYASTHCWQPGGDNVVNWMRQNVPPVLDQDQFQNGQVEILTQYYRKNAETGVLEEFTCDTECSTLCIPDHVVVRVRNYEFRRFVNYLALPPIQLPDLLASTPMEGAGCDPEQGTCLP